MASIPEFLLVCYVAMSGKKESRFHCLGFIYFIPHWLFRKFVSSSLCFTGVGRELTAWRMTKLSFLCSILFSFLKFKLSRRSAFQSHCRVYIIWSWRILLFVMTSESTMLHWVYDVNLVVMCVHWGRIERTEENERSRCLNLWNRKYSITWHL